MRRATGRQRRARDLLLRGAALQRDYLQEVTSAMTTSEAAAYKKPLPHKTSVNTPYWEALKNHELRLPKCNVCGHIWHPPASSVCPNCLTQNDYEFTKLSGRGKIWSWLRMYQRYFAGF